MSKINNYYRTFSQTFLWSGVCKVNKRFFYHRSDYFQDTLFSLKSCIMKQFIFTGGGGRDFNPFEFVHME